MFDEQQTLYAIVAAQKERIPQNIALVAPGRRPLTYAQLYTQVTYVGQFLHSRGIGRNESVALVLPNSPETAAALVGVATYATLAPLNPLYRYDEFATYLAELHARVVIVPAESDSPVIAAAQAAAIPVVRLRSCAAEAGLFTLEGETGYTPVIAEPSQMHDTMLVLHTSGTTGRAKIVPLTQANIYESASTSVRVMQANETSRSMTIMPLFHVGGLGSIYPLLLVGGSVACTPVFDPTRFYHWLDELKPTSFAGAPAMFGVLLAMADANHTIIKRNPVRYVISGASPLSAEMLTRLELTFGAPVLEMYGMTETAASISGNPLPPAVRKLGSVGVPLGVEVRIMDDVGTSLAAGQYGEIVVRGARVMSGYRNNPAANAEAFRDGWFRTGDQGYMDDDGYLFVTGRIKELIDRGGEKISPIEIDRVVMTHPAVAQAVTFAVPDPTMGEAVGIAVILRKDQILTESALRSYLKTRLADFKQPRYIVFADDLPKTAMGKVQRVRLADHFGLSAATPVATMYSAPRTVTEDAIATIWSDLLKVAQPGTDDDFFVAGGDSMLATVLVVRVERALNVRVPLATFFDHPTIAEFAAALDGQIAQASLLPLVCLQPHGSRPPLFLVHGADGYAISFRAFVPQLGDERPIYGFQARGVDGECLPEMEIGAMAANYVAAMRRVQPAGPYQLVGHSMGGSIALEMAQQLRAAGQAVALLGILDTPAPPLQRPLPAIPIPRIVRHYGQRVIDYAVVGGTTSDGWRAARAAALQPFDPETMLAFDTVCRTIALWERLRAETPATAPTTPVTSTTATATRSLSMNWQRLRPLRAAVPPQVKGWLWNKSTFTQSSQLDTIMAEVRRMDDATMQTDYMEMLRYVHFEINRLAMLRYRAKTYDGDIVLFQSAASFVDPVAWSSVVRGRITVRHVPGDHVSMIRQPHATTLAARIKPFLL